jgi:hypothetical protein
MHAALKSTKASLNRRSQLEAPMERYKSAQIQLTATLAGGVFKLTQHTPGAHFARRNTIPRSRSFQPANIWRQQQQQQPNEQRPDNGD